MLHYEHQSQTVDLMFDSENYQGKYEAWSPRGVDFFPFLIMLFTSTKTFTLYKNSHNV
jgi:hypothetical protein